MSLLLSPNLAADDGDCDIATIPMSAAADARRSDSSQAVMAPTDTEKSTASPCSVPEESHGGGAFRSTPLPQHQHHHHQHHRHHQLQDRVEVERSCMETRGHVNVKWDITRKNKTSIVIDGYKMTESRAGKDGRVFWRCSKRFCSATAISLGPRLLSVRQVDSRRFHNHPPTGKEEFFRGDFGSPGTMTPVTIKWPVTRLSVASTGGSSDIAAMPGTFEDDADMETEDPAGVGDEESLTGGQEDAMVDEGAIKRMRHASLGDLVRFQQRLTDPLMGHGPCDADAGVGSGGGVGSGVGAATPGGLQALATAAGLHGNYAASAAAAAAAIQQLTGVKSQHHSQQLLPPQQSPRHDFHQHHQTPGSLQRHHQHHLPAPQADLLGSLEAQKALLTLALTGGLPQPPPLHHQQQLQHNHSQQSQPQVFNSIFNPPPQQHTAGILGDAVNSSPLKEALSQVDNSQLRRQLRRLESYFRSGIVTVSESILRLQSFQQLAKDTAASERDSLHRLFNYIEGLERVHKLCLELS